MKRYGQRTVVVTEAGRRALAEHDAALALECPRCGSPAGSSCRKVQAPHTGAGPAPAGLPPGRELLRMHAERFEASS